MMRVRYVGPSFGVFGLTDGKVYECTEIHALTGALRIIDDEGPTYWDPPPGQEDLLDGYLYSAKNPRPSDGSSPGGRWEIVEDDADGSLHKAIFG